MGASDRNRTIIHVGPAPAPEPVHKSDSVDEPSTRKAEPTAETAEHPSPAAKRPSRGPKRFSPGDMVPGTRYRICRFIGDGGMGAVYEAEHIDLERRVALKILLRELSAAPAAVEMFRKEARTATKVGSDHIVELYDFAELPDGRVLFTMELLSGPTLAQVIHRETMTVPRVLAVLRQVCKGLSGAHAVGVVHRDIKPENIVLERRRGRQDWVKILDFGISEMLTDQPLQGALNAGTPMYLAPELIEGKPYDQRADVYALGCMAYEMVTGRPPFLGEPEGEVTSVLQQHLEDEPVPPSKLALTEIPRSLDAVIMRCLAKSPHQRYPTVDAVEAGLCEAQIEGKLTTSWDDLPVPERVDPMLRDRLLREMPDPDLGPIRRGGRWMWPAVAGLCLVAGAGAAIWYVGKYRNQPAVVAEQTQSAPQVTLVDQLVDEAMAAAAKSYFVYPPPDDEEHPTAYTKIVELEAIEGDLEAQARRRALELRKEFSETLTRLGDAYWENEDGKPFAVDFYKQALVFDRTSVVASSRAALTPDDLEALENKARALEFSEEEIIEAESLAVLAEPDREERKRKIRRIRARRGKKSEEENAATDKLLSVASSDVDVPDLPKAKPAASSGKKKPSTFDPFGDSEQAAPEVAEVAEKKEPAPEPADPAAASSATELAISARKLMRQGDDAKAKTFLDRALTFDPRNPAALAAMLDLTLGKGSKKEALGYAERLAAVQGSNPKNHLRLGDLRFQLGMLQDALASYRKADALGSAQARTKVANLEEELGIVRNEPPVDPNDADEPPPAEGDEAGAEAPPKGDQESKPEAKKTAERATAPAAAPPEPDASAAGG